MNYYEITTLVIALVGAFLGVINTWNQVNQYKVKLKVVPKISHQITSGVMLSGDRECDLDLSATPTCWSIEVINLSKVPITIRQIGFGRTFNGNRNIIFQPDTEDGRSLPVRIEPRQAITFYTAIGTELPSSALKKPVAFAETDCGKVCYGTSLIMKSEAKRILSEQ